MILKLSADHPPLSSYGIEIPAALNRAEQILSVLLYHPVLGPLAANWFLETPGETVTDKDLLRVHSEEYVRGSETGSHEDIIIQAFELIGSEGRFNRYHPEKATRPLEELFDLAVRRTSGTHQCCLEALQHGYCFFLGGGAHHGHRDFGHSFCILNDNVIALRKCQADGQIHRAWVIDVDVHKGDRTAALTRGDESIITLSVHMAEGWPLDRSPRLENGKLHPSFVPSDFDIPVKEGEDYRYLPDLETGLRQMAEGPKPDLALVLCGSDPYEKDALPSSRKTRLTLDQVIRRDRMIYDFLKNLGVPQACLMAGGYGEHAWEPYPPFLEYVLLYRLGVR